METINSTVNLLFSDCFMASIDLKDAYYHVPIHPHFFKISESRRKVRNKKFSFSIPGASIWDHNRSQNLHKDSGRDVSPSQGKGRNPNSIPGRCPSGRKIRVSRKKSDRSAIRCPSKFWMADKLGEITSSALTKTKILGYDPRLKGKEIFPSQGKN